MKRTDRPLLPILNSIAPLKDQAVFHNLAHVLERRTYEIEYVNYYPVDILEKAMHIHRDAKDPTQYICQACKRSAAYTALYCPNPGCKKVFAPYMLSSKNQSLSGRLQHQKIQLKVVMRATTTEKTAVSFPTHYTKPNQQQEGLGYLSSALLLWLHQPLAWHQVLQKASGA